MCASTSSRSTARLSGSRSGNTIFRVSSSRSSSVRSVNPGAGGLQRRLGHLDAAAIVISNVIGGGIFFVPVIVAQLVPRPTALIGAWAMGGALAFAGAMTYAELGAMKPHAGGEYVYIRDAYGPLPAFLYGWTWFAIAKPASVATLVTGLVRILGTFPALAFFGRAAIFKPFLVSYGQIFAIVA